MIHHRTKEFQAILERVNAGLQKIFCTQSPVLTFAASGTGVMEASVANLLSKGDTVISISAGKWGERYRNIAQAYGLDVKSIEIPYGEAITAASVREALKDHPSAKAVLITLCETSTAVTHPVREIAAVTRGTPTLLLVDAISGLACDTLFMDDWGIDVVLCGSQKGLMLPPGLAFAALNERAIRALPESNLPKFYFNFSEALKAMKKKESLFTPAVSLIQGLDEALTMLIEEGIEKVWKRHADVAALVRDKVSALGLRLFSKAPSNSLTAIVMPDGVASGTVIQLMRDSHRVVMADGQGELQGKIVRFAHMGYACTMSDAKKGYDAFLDAMIKSGWIAHAHSHTR